MDYAIVACIIGFINAVAIFFLSLALYMRHAWLVWKVSNIELDVSVIYKKAYECELMLYNLTQKDKDNK